MDAIVYVEFTVSGEDEIEIHQKGNAIRDRAQEACKDLGRVVGLGGRPVRNPRGA
jgi:hypothetical protein